MYLDSLEARMKKSRSITLTVVSALGMAARAQQAPTTPSVPLILSSCEERRDAAKRIGTLFTENCGNTTITPLGTSRAGFGATGEGHSGGG
jgi:hypothetical protein